MNNKSYSAMLRELCDSYYNRHISLEQYRTQRKLILDGIDRDYNGVDPESESTGKKDSFMDTVSFDCNELKNSELKKTDF